MIVLNSLPFCGESTFDYICKQFGPSSGLTGSKLFDTLIVFLKEFFEKSNLKKVSRRQQKHENYPACKRLTVSVLLS